MDEMISRENLYDCNDYQQNPCSTEEIRQRCKTICTVNDCLHLVENIFDCFKVIAVDIQGRNINKGGPISVLILATSNCCCFLLDLYLCPEMMSEGGLSKILECVELVKVIHNSRRFTNVLENCYNICTRNIFDTQVAFRTIEAIRNNCIPQCIEPVPLQRISNIFGRHMQVASDYDLECLIARFPNIWECRPLVHKACEMVARNVLSLLPEAYVRMLKEIKNEYVGVYIQMMHNFSQGICPASHPCSVDSLQRPFDIFEQKMNNISTCRNHDENYSNIYCSCNERLNYNRRHVNSETSLCSCNMIRCQCMCQNSTRNCLRSPKCQHLCSPSCRSIIYTCCPKKRVSPFSSKFVPKFSQMNSPISKCASETLCFGINPFTNDCVCENVNERDLIWLNNDHKCPRCGLPFC